MCELLGMSANVPTDICFSFTGLMRRGGQTGRHGDGWGVAFYEGKGCRAFHDAAPGASSPLAHFLRQHPIKSRIVVSHVRRANRGRIAIENTHPFQRELWGRRWSFAHNGQLRGVKRLQLERYRTVGTTDSEHAFCWVLDQLRARWSRCPGEQRLIRAIEALCRKLAALGTFNLILSEGTRLYAYCSTKLVWLTRRAPFGVARLVDEDLMVDFTEETNPGDIVSVVATCPLTANERWTPIERGSLLVFRDGLPLMPGRTAQATRRRPAILGASIAPPQAGRAGAAWATS